MNSKTANYILFGIVLLVVVAGIVSYPMLPDQIASHWNAAGEADGYMGKFWGMFLFPLIMAVMFLIYLAIPRIDPLRKNIESFRPTYNAFWVWMLSFFAYVFGLSMAWNFGYRFNFTVAMVPAVSVLLYVLGEVLGKSKRNWFMGIRTPWTLSSDIVWEKTHKLGGKLFKAAALVSLAGIFVRGPYVIAAIVIPVALATIAAVVYSYVEHRKKELA